MYVLFYWDCFIYSFWFYRSRTHSKFILLIVRPTSLWFAAHDWQHFVVIWHVSMFPLFVSDVKLLSGCHISIQTLTNVNARQWWTSNKIRIKSKFSCKIHYWFHQKALPVAMRLIKPSFVNHNGEQITFNCVELVHCTAGDPNNAAIQHLFNKSMFFIALLRQCNIFDWRSSRWHSICNRWSGRWCWTRYYLEFVAGDWQKFRKFIKHHKKTVHIGRHRSMRELCSMVGQRNNVGFSRCW